MSYAAAVETVMPPMSQISPRLIKSVKTGKRKGPKTTTANTKFSIFDAEQPKPHIVHVDPKQFRCEQADKSSAKRGKGKNKASNQRRTSTTAVPTPAPVKNCPDPTPDPPQQFKDSISYLSHHHMRLQRLLAASNMPGLILSARSKLRVLEPPVAKPIDEEQFHCLKLEATALLNQNRSMLSRWMNSDLLIS